MKTKPETNLQNLQAMFPPGLWVVLTITLFFMLLGCSGVWRGAYVGGAATKEFVTDTHKELWSSPLRRRVGKCERELDPATNSKDDFDACTAPYTAVANQDVVKALRTYHAAAKALSAALLAWNPDHPDRAAIREAFALAVSAAEDLFRLFPESKEALNTLRKITR